MKKDIPCRQFHFPHEVGNRKIGLLLVEDNLDDALLIKRLFSKCNRLEYEIEWTDQLTSAVEQMIRHRFDIVVLDLCLPDSKGIDTIKRLRRQNMDTPIIVLTGTEDEDMGFAAIRFGAQDFIQKGDISPDLMERTILYTLERDRFQKALKSTARDLEQTVEELKRANRKIIAQQQSVIEEERLKILLQLTGARASQLSRPLSELLDGIELLKRFKGEPEELLSCLTWLEEAGRKLAGTVEKIQTIPRVDSHEAATALRRPFIHKNLRIMLIEPDETDFKKIEFMMENIPKSCLVRAESLGEALELIEKESFDLIILEYFLSDGNGIDFLKKLKERNVSLPVISVTGQGNEIIASRVIQYGAYDYIPKAGLHLEPLLSNIHTAMEKHRLKLETDRAMKQLVKMSTRDELTGLYNRRYFMEVLEREVSRASRYGNDLVLAMIDLDFFKDVNDSHGHLAGDYVLKKVARFLMENFRHCDLVCRYGGEEFVVILSDTSQDAAWVACERFRERIEEYGFDYDGARFSLTVSIGIAHFKDAQLRTAHGHLALADKALYEAKKSGRNRVVKFSEIAPEEKN